MMDTFSKKLIGALGEVLADVQKKEHLNERSIEIDDLDVYRIRQKYELTQFEFSRMFGVSIRTLQKWEQRQRRPQGAARTLLKVVDYAPDVVNKALHRESPHETIMKSPR